MKNQNDQREVYIGEIKDYKEIAALINGNLITTHHALPATDAEKRSPKEIIMREERLLNAFLVTE